MGLLNTLAVGLYAGLFNIIGALLVTRLLPEGFAVGVELIDAVLAMLATHASSNLMLMSTSVLVSVVAITAKLGANLTVRD